MRFTLFTPFIVAESSGSWLKARGSKLVAQGSWLKTPWPPLFNVGWERCESTLCFFWACHSDVSGSEVYCCRTKVRNTFFTKIFNVKCAFALPPAPPISNVVLKNSQSHGHFSDKSSQLGRDVFLNIEMWGGAGAAETCNEQASRCTVR